MTHHDRALRSALEKWGQRLGADAVRSDTSLIERYARTTAPRGSRPAAVVFPSSTEQVQQIVAVASEFGIALHPISRGKNWGYGDACAATDGQVIVDLQRMNKIVEVNEALAYAVLEPGVTQGQLYEHLQQQHVDLWMDATGAGPEASVVGNTLERGFGHTPCGDRFQNSAGLEIVLPNHEILRTGFAHYPQAHAKHCYPYGIGPTLDGLFTQSNLGIVTKIGIWLNRKPESLAAFFVSAPNPGALPDLIDRLASLRQQGLVRSSVHVANDLRVMSLRHRRSLGRLSAQERERLRRESGLGAWMVSGAIYGARNTVGPIARAIRRVLAPYKTHVLTAARLRQAQTLARWLRPLVGERLQKRLSMIEPAFDLLRGKPTDHFLRGFVPQGVSSDPSASLDPLDHGVGLLWISPVAPAQGSHARAVMKLIEPIYAAHHFDCPVTMTFVNDRSLCIVTNITFDQNNHKQREAAERCHTELLRALIEVGYPPYRTGPNGFEEVRQDDVFWQTCQQVKTALDPKGIMSPGRYVG